MTTEDQMAIFVLIVLPILFVCSILHIIQAIAVWRIAKIRKKWYYWLAIFPLISTFIMYLLALEEAGHRTNGIYLIPHLFIFFISVLVIWVIPFIYFIIKYYSFYKLTIKYNRNSSSHILFPFFTFGLFIPIDVYVASKKMKEEHLKSKRRMDSNPYARRYGNSYYR